MVHYIVCMFVAIEQSFPQVNFHMQEGGGGGGGGGAHLPVIAAHSEFQTHCDWVLNLKYSEYNMLCLAYQSEWLPVTESIHSDCIFF